MKSFFQIIRVKYIDHYAVTTNFIDFVSRDGQNIRVSMEDIYKAFPEESAKILRKMFKESEKREIDLRHGRKGGKIEKEKHPQGHKRDHNEPD